MVKKAVLEKLGCADFISLDAVRQARGRIARHINDTPLVRSDSLGGAYLKLETMQRTGAFKLRGATNKLLQLTDDEKRRGVVTVSTGNHGRAVAYAAKGLGIKATVCMSDLVPGNKREAIKALGAEIVIAGRSQDEAALAAAKLVAQDGMVLVPPFDDPDIIAGQGTIGLEIAESLPDVGTVIVPLSGGGLLAGIAFALKSLKTDIRIIGVSTLKCPAMARSIEAGKPVDVEELESVADSLGGGIGLDNRYSFSLVRDLVDDIVLLDEREIIAAMRHLFYEEGLVTEGAAATSVAALLADKGAGKGKDWPGPVVCVVSGRNIDMQDFLRLVG